MLHEAAQGLAGVQDVIEQQHMPATHIGEQFDAELELPGAGARAPVARGLDQADAQRDIEPAHEVGQPPVSTPTVVRGRSR